MIISLRQDAPPPTPVDERPVPLPTGDSLAARAQAGLDGGSGMVPPWRQLTNGYGGENGITEFVGHQPLDTDYQAMPDLPPDSLYADRAMYGGVRASVEQYGYQDEHFTGGHVVLTNRPPLVLVVSDQMAPQTWVAPTEWRDAPSVIDLCRRTPDMTAGGMTNVQPIG